MATSRTSASSVYVNVMEDVINNVREEFMNEGAHGESLLNELQGIWEMKMMQGGVVRGAIEDLNVPYEPTAKMLFPPVTTPVQNPLPSIPQQDGTSDAISKVHAGTTVKTFNKGDNEELLNEGDDDDDDDEESGNEDKSHLVLAQFDKVSRTKNKWKCTLTDGIMHINNKDILFNKVTGAFEF